MEPFAKGVILPANRMEAGGDGSIGRVFDCIIQEAPEYTTTPATSQLEGGADATDHIKIEPDKVTLDIVISAIPIDGSDELDPDAPGVPEIIRQAHSEIKSLQGQLVDIVAGLETYTSMTMTSYTPSRNAKTGNVLKFTAMFQKIRFVTTETTTVVMKSQPKSAQKKQDLGKQAPAVPTEPQKAVAKSWLAQGIDKTGLGAAQ
jgi:hypothetical protein